MMKTFITVSLLTLSFFNTSFSNYHNTFVDPNIAFGEEFHQKNKTAYLSCEKSMTDSLNNCAHYIFGIYAEKPETPLTHRVGKIEMSLSETENDAPFYSQSVNIDVLEISKRSRRKGYGKAALQIALDIFRDASRSSIQFSHFYLIVRSNNIYAPARALYTQLGFQKKQEDETHWEMTLLR